MADLIARLKLESGEYDAKIKRAVTGLQQMETECRKVGGTLAILEKDQKQYVQALGQMQTVSTSVRGKIGEMTSAFTDLRSQYNHLTDEEKKGDFGRALSASLDTLKGRIKDAREELKGIQEEMNGKEKGGGLFSRLGDKMSGAIQVFAGNMMTKATMAVADFGNEMMEAVQQSVELAKSAEGIRAAYDRLGNAHLMAQLKEETHGTVSELQLMKAAVRFNDFKLPLSELGTMLAFAQQKAKDTGQSVDYMVDSIVTGLGRKSKLILDNLGISAADIDEHMKKTGDMTLAVGEIIREQMGKAGDYIETAADRAAKANADLEDAMLRLGDTFKPLTDSASSMWNSIKIGAIDLLNNAVKPLINALTEAGRMRQYVSDIQDRPSGSNGQTHQQRVIGMLRHYSGNKQQLYNRQMSIYDQQESKAWADVNKLRKDREETAKWVKEGGNTQARISVLADLDRRIEEGVRKAQAWQTVKANYANAAQPILNPVKPDRGTGGTGTTDDKKGGKTTKTKPQLTLEQQTALDVQKAEKGYADALAMAQTKLIENVTTSDEYDKEIQKGQQSLADAYLKAYTATGDEKYLTAYRETADHVKTLQEGIDQHAKAQKEAAEGLKRQSLNLGSTGGLSTLISTLKSDQAAQTIGSQEWDNTTAKLMGAENLQTITSTALASGVDASKVAEMTEPLRNALKDNLIDKDGVSKMITDLVESANEQMAESPLKMQVVVDNAGIVQASKNLTTEVEKQREAWKKTGTVIGLVGQAFNAFEDPAAKIMGTVAQAIATVALAYADAMAKDQTQKFNIFGFIAAATAATISMVSTIASIHSATGYAQGGIIKGDSYSGDNIPANTFVNAGELVLNRAQQGNLASQLEQGGGVIGFGTPYVTGEMIFLGLNNYMRSHGYGELIPSRR